MNIFEKFKQNFLEHCKKTIIINDNIVQNSTFTLNSDSKKTQFGDINSNLAIIAAKICNKNPKILATDLTINFKSELLEKITIDGVGFINFFMTQAFFKKLSLELFLKKFDFFKPLNSNALKINIEFVSANPTGELHFGHGRNGVIGDVLSNILSFCENKITKEFYINDAGSQITKLGIALKEIYLTKINNNQNESMTNQSYQSELLNKCAEQLILKHSYELSEKPIAFFSEFAKNFMLQHIKNTLNKFGIKFDNWFSEQSLYKNNEVETAIKILTEKNYIYKEDTTTFFKATEFGDDKDRVIQKANNEFTYIAADIAYLINKLNRGYDKLIMILGHDHHSYLTRLKILLTALGYESSTLEIILYQLVNIIEDGEKSKMSKRAGKVINLDNIINTIGVDATRFFFINRKSDSQLDFNIKLALQQNSSNPVFYIQYAYVRCVSILNKANNELSINLEQLKQLSIENYTELEIQEILLIKKIVALKELLKNICNNYQINLLANFTIELATIFSQYYNTTKILDSNDLNKTLSKLLLIKNIKNTLKLCFDLIGIKALEKM